MDGLSSEEDIRFRIYPDTKRELYELVIMNKDIVEFLLRMPECEYHHYPALHPSGGVRIDPAGMSKQGAQEALRVLHGAEEWIRGYGAKKNTGTWMMS